VGQLVSIPVAAQSKAWVCGRSPAGVAGSNPAGSMDICVLYSKDERQSQDNEDKKVQLKYRERTKKMLVESLRPKPGEHGFDSRWCYLDFS
jgi:hypothetical protein